MRLQNLLFAFALVALTALSTGCTTVESGQVGVKAWLGGNAADEVLDPGGMQFTMGYSVDNISLGAQSFTDDVPADSTRSAIVTFVVTQGVECPEGSADCVPVPEEQTLQPLGYTANIQWRIASPEAAVALYRRYRLREGGEQMFAQSQILPISQVAAKSIFGEYNLRQLLVEEREAAAVAVQEELQRLLNARLEVPENSVVIDAVSITNFDYDDDLDEMFRATVAASEQRNLAQQELERLTIEMEQEVAQAEASRRATVERAEGAAEAARLEADASRYAREQEAASFVALSEAGVDVNEYHMIEMLDDNWTGGVPMVQTSGSEGSSNSPVVLPLNLSPR